MLYMLSLVQKTADLMVFTGGSATNHVFFLNRFVLVSESLSDSFRNRFVPGFLKRSDGDRWFGRGQVLVSCATQLWLLKFSGAKPPMEIKTLPESLWVAVRLLVMDVE